MFLDVINDKPIGGAELGEKTPLKQRLESVCKNPKWAAQSLKTVFFTSKELLFGYFMQKYLLCSLYFRRLLVNSLATKSAPNTGRSLMTSKSIQEKTNLVSKNKTRSRSFIRRLLQLLTNLSCRRWSVVCCWSVRLLLVGSFVVGRFVCCWSVRLLLVGRWWHLKASKKKKSWFQ